MNITQGLMFAGITLSWICAFLLVIVWIACFSYFLDEKKPLRALVVLALGPVLLGFLIGAFL